MDIKGINSLFAKKLCSVAQQKYSANFTTAYLIYSIEPESLPSLYPPSNLLITKLISRGGM